MLASIRNKTGPTHTPNHPRRELVHLRPRSSFHRARSRCSEPKLTRSSLATQRVTLYWGVCTPTKRHKKWVARCALFLIKDSSYPLARMAHLGLLLYCSMPPNISSFSSRVLFSTKELHCQRTNLLTYLYDHNDNAYRSRYNPALH
jgi:hypothetical protein